MLRPTLIALLVLPLLACGSSAPSHGTPPITRATIAAGDAALAVDTTLGTLTLSRAGQVLLVFTGDSFQLGTVDAPLDDGLSYDPYWLEPGNPTQQAVTPAGFEWESAGQLSIASLGTDTLVLGLLLPRGHLTLTLKAEAPGRFSALLVPTVADPGAEAIAWMRLRPQVDASEQFYGLGEWGDGVVHRGKQRPMQIELDTLESGYNEAHAPVPLLIGTRGWGLFVADRHAGLFDVARKDPAAVEATFGTAKDSAKGLAFHLFAAAPLDITGLYEQVAGAPALPAPWALGPMMWRNETTGQAQVADDAQQLRARHLAASGYWLDRPYASGVNTFDFDLAKFTDGGAAIANLRAQGLRVALWHAPYVAPAGNSEAAAQLNREAVSAGYFPSKTGILLNSWSAPLDFTNAAAVTWWQGLLGRYTSLGVEGFKLDFAEDVQLGFDGARDPWTFADGSDERTGQSTYQLAYHQTYAKLLPAGGGFLLCRTGRWGDQRSGSILWPGDLEADFSNQGDALANGSASVGGLPTALYKGLGLGASGFAFYASDTGGFRNSPGNAALCPGGSGPCLAARELFLRWTELSALGTAMEVGNGASFMPWEYSDANGLDDTALAIYQRYASLAMRLFPYKWSYAQRLAQDGRAIQRPLGLVYPQLTTQPSDEFLLGDSILAAPVLVQGQTARALVLPPGDWLDWWTGQLQPGGAAGTTGTTLVANAPIDTAPLFLAAGGIVPMLRPTIDTLAPATTAGIESYANDPGILYVRVAPAAAASQFALFDGSVLTQSQDASGLHLGFMPASAPVFSEGVIFEAIATPAPQAVSSDSTPLPQAASVAELPASGGWFWESATSGTLWIRAPGAAQLTAH